MSVDALGNLVSEISKNTCWRERIRKEDKGIVERLTSSRNYRIDPGALRRSVICAPPTQHDVLNLTNMDLNGDGRVSDAEASAFASKKANLYVMRCCCCCSCCCCCCCHYRRVLLLLHC